MWIWASNRGVLYRLSDDHAITIIGKGYAGHGAGVNNTLYEDIRELGPLPQGWYTIGEPQDHPRLGPFVMRLMADASNQMHGRTGFYVHGDNTTPDPRDASRGCIVLDRAVREKVAASGNRRLRVVDL